MGNGVLYITKKIENYQQDKNSKLLISYLISKDTQVLDGAQNDELNMTRRKLNGVRVKAVNERKALEYTMEKQMTTTALPQ